jgi:hypothetical protein
MSKKMQVHKRIVLFYMKEVLEGYLRRFLRLAEALSLLGLSRSHFFRYLRVFRTNPAGFGFTYARKTANHHLSTDSDHKIAESLRREKELIENAGGKIRRINFQALSLELSRTEGFTVSPETIRQKAILWNLHEADPRGAKIYREVETTKIGRLFQHDTCLHQWSPCLPSFYLILTVDDHSRRIVFAKFFWQETSMNHILSVRDVAFCWGLPLAYYTDRHSIFTFNRRPDNRRNYRIEVEDAEIQWQRVMGVLEIQGILAQSPQAKGKVESKFKYLQGRVVRRCAKEEVRTMEHAQRILDEEVRYYNEVKPHEVTGQTPKERWEAARVSGRSVLRPCVGRGKDIFCLEYTKKLDAYGKTKIKGIEIQLKKSPSKQVTVRYIEESGEKEIRVWCKDQLLKVIKA